MTTSYVPVPHAPDLPRRAAVVVDVVRGDLADAPVVLEPGVGAVAVPVAPPADGEDDVQPRLGTADLALRYGVDLGDLAERTGLGGAAGESSTVHLPRSHATAAALPWAGLPPRVVLVGVGAGGDRDLRRAGAALARATRGVDHVVTTVGAEAGPAGLRAAVEGFLLAGYQPPRVAAGAAGADQRETAEPPGPPQRRLTVLLPPDRWEPDGERAAAAVAGAESAAAAAWLARDLANLPSNLKNPAWLAGRAAGLGAAAGVDVRVLGPDDLAAQGFGGLRAVGGGSAAGPRLVVVDYVPAGGAGMSGRRHVVLVGKGITYDTGGLAIKPREAMVPMKTDMAGAAAVLAATLAAAAQRLPHRVTALLPLAENAVSGSSYRPGDVVRTYGGRTVEIGNTDAEGRIVLADALAYADAQLRPDVVVDVATLTGAATLGLGPLHGALYSDSDDLAASLERAGEDSGEPLWRMPLVEDYRAALDSAVADVRQVSGDPALGGGSIIAALFLREFAGGRRWAHLDIAGPARARSDAHEVTEGATGFGARALLRWLEELG